MGLLSGVSDALGLTPDLSGAIGAAAFDPFNIQTSFGSATYDEDSRTFTSGLGEDYGAIQDSLVNQLKQIDPAQQLALFRQQAQPYNEQQGLNLENRLFSQGLTQASGVDEPLGARRSLFDSFANQDLQFQQLAQQQALQQQTGLMNQLFGLNQMEQGLFAPQATFGQIQTGAGANQAGLMAQQASFLPNLVGNIIAGGVQGAAMGGMMGGMGGGTPWAGDFVSDDMSVWG